MTVEELLDSEDAQLLKGAGGAGPASRRNDSSCIDKLWRLSSIVAKGAHGNHHYFTRLVASPLLRTITCGTSA